MADNNTPVPVDPPLVDLGSADEMTRWMMKFGCTREQLVEAVRRVGTSSEAVRRHLGQ